MVCDDFGVLVALEAEVVEELEAFSEGVFLLFRQLANALVIQEIVVGLEEVQHYLVNCQILE